MPAERPALSLYARTLATLIIVSVAVRVLPFKSVATWATRSVAPKGAAPDIGKLQRVIGAWCRRLPWRTLCLEQGITASHLLARAGAPVTLSYGAAMIDDDLHAHVWVRSGIRDVCGCENAADYAILSQFSNDSSSSSVQP